MQHTGQHTILLIEDEEDLRDSIRQILDFEGYLVIPAENGEAGLEKLSGNKVDLIICDIMMPGINGIEVFRTIRSADETRHIPFVFISSLSRYSDVTRMNDLGLEPGDYLEKPFTMLQLLNCVRSNLHQVNA